MKIPIPIDRGENGGDCSETFGPRRNANLSKDVDKTGMDRGIGHLPGESWEKPWPLFHCVETVLR